MSSVLKVSGLSRTFGRGDYQVNALMDINFSINRGEFVLIVGSSGSGKSTLLNQMGLLDRPTTGTIHIDGVNTTNMNEGRTSSFRNRKLGFIFQFSNLLTDLTVLENVMLPMQISGRRGAREYAIELLGAVGLRDYLHKRTDRISGGQAQRVAVARGLANKPSVVLADEPTGNLDSANSADVVQLMKSMSKQLNQTFVVVTHDTEDFGDVDRIIRLKDGRILSEMAPEVVS